MPDRATVRRLQNAPLVLALAQVRFEAILDMAKCVPALQRELKVVGFPRYKANQIPQLMTVQDGVPEMKFAEQWQFHAANRDTAIVLTTDFVTVVTRRYSTFEHFLPQVLAVCTHLKNVSTVQLVDRAGLRYVDLIRPRPGETIADYVQPGLRGLPVSSLEGLGASPASIESDTRFVTRAGTLAVRFRQLPRGAWLPPDLDISVLANPVAMDPSESAFVLDCDHFRENLDADFDLAVLKKVLLELHSGTAMAFRAAVTPRALETWGPEVEEEVTP